MNQPITGLASLIFNWQKWRSETSEQCSADIPQYCGMVKIANFAKPKNFMDNAKRRPDTERQLQ
jgi:hypothetical protein